MSELNESQFRARVDEALKVVARVLENNRHPKFPEDVQHQYEDKYMLAEFVTNTALAAQLNVFEILGLTEEKVKQLKEWATSKAVTVRFTSEERCEFVKETTRKVESDTAHVREYSGLGGKLTRTDKVITKVTEYFWKFTLKWELFVYGGTDLAGKVVLREGAGEVEVMTTSKVAPRPKVKVCDPVEANIRWMLENISDALTLSFAIDRSSASCHTPRRNEDITRALRYFSEFNTLARHITSYFVNTVFPVQQKHELDLACINTNGVFVPVVPLFDGAGEEGEGEGATTSKCGSPVLDVGDLNLFLAEQRRTMEEKFTVVAKSLPDDTQLITSTVASFVVVMLHAVEVSSAHKECVDYVEDMLYKQLQAAIGKVLTPVDFANYMRFHNRKLFKSEYQPKPFCYAIRRPDHYPEGIVSVEASLDDGSIPNPIVTSVNSAAAAAPMKFAINASTDIAFGGERLVHAYIMHQFSGQSGLHLALTARARQFSSFVLMVGRITAADRFEPASAIIIKNKDDLSIPLMLETIPTPKEFADAIESLSPEQQRFAKAFRSMQLESTLFAVCVIQIKPQLEKVLNLPDDALTKEIRLSEDLMDLFIKYQIPSDLLSFDGDEAAPLVVKLDEVKKHVSAMKEMIGSTADEQLLEEQNRQKFHLAQENDARDSLHFDSADFGEMKKKKKKKKGSAPMKVTTRTSTRSSSSSGSTAPVDAGSSSAKVPSTDLGESMAPEGVVDYTRLPVELDAKFAELDEDNALRPTIITEGSVWARTRQATLLSKPESRSLNAPEQVQERNAAFDLLDGLTKSGALSIDTASLHVMLAATHCFDKSLVDTVVRDNVNPIEKVERSLLIVASTVQDAPAVDLVKEDQLERVKTYSSILFQ